MVRVFYYGTFIIALAGLVLGALVFPGDDEVAFLEYKDQNYSKAYVLYESQVKKGNYSLNVVTPLADLYLKYGEVEKAIDLLEIFIQQNPTLLVARERLGLYYQYAQRHDDYRRNLEILYQLRPSPAILRKLSNIYNFNGQYQRQIEVLEELTSRFPAAKQDYSNLAYLYATQKKYEKAVVTLERYMEKQGGKAAAEIVELMMSLLIDSGKPDQALAVGKAQSDQNRLTRVLQFANRLHERGQVEGALSLVEPYADVLVENPSLLQEYVLILIDLDRKEEAYSLLRSQFENKQLPDQLQALFLTLALERNDAAQIRRFIDQSVLETLAADLLLELIVYLQENKDQTAVARVDQKLSGEFLSDHPLLQIVLTLAMGKKSNRQQATQVRRLPWLSNEQRLQLAFLYQKLKQPIWAQEILADVSSLSNIQKFDPFAVSRLFMDLKMSPRGLALFDEKMNAQSAGTDASRRELEYYALLLALAAGEDKRVRRYLRQEKEVNAQLLSDIYFLAESRDQRLILLESSRRLYQKESSELYLTYYVEALLINEMYAEALPLLRRLDDRNSKDWIFKYSEVLEKLGRSSEWAELWFSQAHRPDLVVQEKRNIAYSFLEKGYRTEAQVLFLQLAQNKGPDDADVGQLLAIWASSFDAAATDWLLARVRSGDEVNRIRWFQHLYRFGRSLNQMDEVEASLILYPELMATLVKLEIENGRAASAYERLKELLSEGQLRLEVARIYIGLAIEKKDQDQLEQIIFKNEIEQFPAEILVPLFNSLLIDSSAATRQKYRRGLSAGFFDRHPTIAFMFQVADSSGTVRQQFSEVENEFRLTPRHAILLAEFLFHFGYHDLSGQMLNNAFKLEVVTEDELDRIARLYLSIGEPETGLRFFQHHRRLLASDFATPQQLDRVYLLLATAAGRTDEVRQKIGSRSYSNQFLTDLYFVALDHNQPNISLIAANRLFKQQPDRQSLIYRTRAQLLNKRLKGALPGLRKLVRIDQAEWEFTYLDTLEKLGKKEEWLQYLNESASHENITAERKREIAFLFLEKGFRTEAETLFMDLAADAEPRSEAVKQLVYLWGVRPRPYAVLWLTDRMKTAPAHQKTGWLRLLNEIGQEKEVIRYLENPNHRISNSMKDLYLEILINQGEIDKLETVLKAEVNQARQPKRLKLLAKIGQQNNLPDIVKMAYEKALPLATSDMEALNEYGKILYYQGNVSKAERLLKRFLDAGGIDYTTSFIYAEIQWGKRRRRLARTHYASSLELMDLRIINRDSDRPLQAKILYRLDQKEKSRQIYRELVKQDPSDQNLRAEYIDLLMDMDRTDEAEKVLEGIN
jgi:lipopolysaccharide biosynthesis regulator YciM/Flp pilus assembly protein TadD